MENDFILPDVIRVIKEKCVNCHQCIAVCPVKYCNDASNTNDGIKINSNLCIGCGRCLKVCTHQAREIIDDTDKFINDLQNGENIATLVAPAIDVNFPGELGNLLGWFKDISVQKNFDVSFGAEITTYQYLQHYINNAVTPIIAQPCPCIVNYIEIYKPNLIKYLAPTGSPVMDMAQWVHLHYPEYKLAFISPCIAKKREFDDPNTKGLVSYNVTVQGLKKYMNDNHISLKNYQSTTFDGPLEAEKGILYSQPGGLTKALGRYKMPFTLNQIRRVEGVEVYEEFFNELEQQLNKDNYDVILIDILNCSHGCNRGTGTIYNERTTNEALHIQSKRMDMHETLHYRHNSDFENLENLLESMADIDFSRKYSDKSAFIQALQDPTPDIVDVIHQQMGKDSKKDIKNCGACGYNSCEMMTKAILNGLYRPQQCHHYLESYYRKYSGEGDFKYIPLKRLTRHRYHIMENIAKEKYYYFNNLFIKFGWLYQKKGTKTDISNVINEVFNAHLTIDDIATKPFNELIDAIIDYGSKYINNFSVTADLLKDTIRKSYRINTSTDNSLNTTMRSCIENITFFENQKKSIEANINNEAESFTNQISRLTSIIGVNVITAAGIIAEIGGITRFEEDDMLLKEAGLHESQANNLDANIHLKYYLLHMTDQLKKNNPVFSEYYKIISTENKTSSYKEILNIMVQKTVSLIFAQFNI